MAIDPITKRLLGKYVITARMKVLTGLRIGGSEAFAAIGGVDNVVIRDPLTQQPMLPASSIKGKLRYLMARSKAKGVFIDEIPNEPVLIHRLFGFQGSKGRDNAKPAVPARLQFVDAFLSEESVRRMSAINQSGLYLTEVKSENTISRKTSEANPRQNERIPAGAEFNLKLVYNCEGWTADDVAAEVKEDFAEMADAFVLLQLDYLGGSGTRGYGRVAFEGWTVEPVGFADAPAVSGQELTALLGKTTDDRYRLNAYLK